MFLYLLKNLPSWCLKEEPWSSRKVYCYCTVLVFSANKLSKWCQPHERRENFNILVFFKVSITQHFVIRLFGMHGWYWCDLYQYLTNLMRKICFTISFISCLYMFRAHVLIIRRSKLHYTYGCDDTRGCVMQFWPPDDEHMCSKHVEAWNKTYCETNFVLQVG